MFAVKEFYRVENIPVIKLWKKGEKGWMYIEPLGPLFWIPRVLILYWESPKYLIPLREPLSLFIKTEYIWMFQRSCIVKSSHIIASLNLIVKIKFYLLIYLLQKTFVHPFVSNIIWNSETKDNHWYRKICKRYTLYLSTNKK